jgi:uncharacterized protein
MNEPGAALKQMKRNKTMLRINRNESLSQTRRGTSGLLRPILIVCAFLTLSVLSGWTQAKANDPTQNPAFQKDLAAANAGDVKAQIKVAKFYYHGPNRARNYAEAARWFKAASQQGSQESSAWLGSMMMYGRGVPRDYDQGIALITQAANAHDPVGLRFAGELVQRVGRDNVQAASLFQQAADLGDANAMTWLGRMYLMGRGVPKDRNKAISLFNQGAAKGDEWAELALGRIFLQKDQNNPNRAIQLFKDSAAQGNAIAALRVGLMLQSGKDVPQDLTTAARYLRQSAGSGYGPGERALGHTFELGIGVPVNQVYAFIWYNLASQQGDKVAAERLAMLTGTMAPADLQKAQLTLSRWNTIIYPDAEQ